MGGDLVYRLHEGLIFGLGQLVNLVNLEFWHDEDMAVSLGVNVEEGERLFVFVDFITWYLPFDDFRENTFHNSIVSRIWTNNPYEADFIIAMFYNGEYREDIIDCAMEMKLLELIHKKNPEAKICAWGTVAKTVEAYDSFRDQFMETLKNVKMLPTENIRKLAKAYK